ncbi:MULTISPECIES: ribbon-helix-helix protein, CopG family [unclassified Sphingomonas]|uniref:ribbon-helix-helix protein, CopG family n=1 Tax=unclassified Sphingomonas TaxID=196159 RepID=UPI0019100C0D|nr:MULTISPECIES: ribbon-helix-helix protein, CopG family [unclassified Sphingomonas]
MAASKTVRSTVLLPEPVHRQVQAVAAAHDVSSAWVIRQAVLQYLSTRAGQSELPLGTGRS